LGNLKGQDFFRVIGIDGRIILKKVLKIIGYENVACVHQTQDGDQ
jgi:hypothetical protein